MNLTPGLATEAINTILPQNLITVAPNFVKNDSIRTYNKIQDAIDRANYHHQDSMVLIEVYPGIYEEDLEIMKRGNIAILFKPGAMMKGTSDNSEIPVLKVAVGNCMIYNFAYGDFTQASANNNKNIIIAIEEGARAYFYNTVISKCVGSVGILIKYFRASCAGETDNTIKTLVNNTYANSCIFYNGNIDAGAAIAVRTYGYANLPYFEKSFYNTILENNPDPEAPKPVIWLDNESGHETSGQALIFRGTIIANGFIEATQTDKILEFEDENLSGDLISFFAKDENGKKYLRTSIAQCNLGLDSTTETIAGKYIMEDTIFEESQTGQTIDLNVDSLGNENIPPLATGMYVNAYIMSDSPDSYFKIWKYGETDPTQCIMIYPQKPDIPIEIQFPIGISQDQKLGYDVYVDGDSVEMKLTLLGWFFGRDER